MDGDPQASQEHQGLASLFVFFLAALCFVRSFTMTIRTDERREKKGRMGLKHNRKWVFFYPTPLHFRRNLEWTHSWWQILPLITATVWKYESGLTACFVRCHHTLSLVIIQRSPVLKKLVCWSASWLIVSRPPKTQHEACRIIVFFIVVWVVSRSCEYVVTLACYKLSFQLP